MGSLRDQLLYPNVAAARVDPRNPPNDKVDKAPSVTDTELLNILDAVDLGELASRAGGEADE